MSADKLYTMEMLSAAVELADYPLLGVAALHGSARSESCGSSLDLDIQLDSNRAVEQIGLQVRACAVGQAAAAIFARHAVGRTAEQIERTYTDLLAWLNKDGPAPDWPDIDLIAPAYDYRGRHGAMLLPWKAAAAALSSVPASG